MKNLMIETRNVKRSFGEVEVLKGLNVQVSQGEQVSIQGASGSGKSTLLYLLGGLDQSTSGEVIVNDKNLSELNEEQLAEFRNLDLGFVFQFHFLLPAMSCLENMMLPARIAGKGTREISQWVNELAKNLGVQHCLNRLPSEISGGEQQRISIIRALSLRPKLILCDEPTGNLDSKNSMIVAELLKFLAREMGSTLVVVTHDSSVASHYSKKIIIEDGLIIS